MRRLPILRVVEQALPIIYRLVCQLWLLCKNIWWQSVGQILKCQWSAYNHHLPMGVMVTWLVVFFSLLFEITSWKSQLNATHKPQSLCTSTCLTTVMRITWSTVSKVLSTLPDRLQELNAGCCCGSSCVVAAVAMAVAWQRACIHCRKVMGKLSTHSFTGQAPAVSHYVSAWPGSWNIHMTRTQSLFSWSCVSRSPSCFILIFTCV